MQLTDTQVLRAMQLLGLRREDFHAVQTAPSFEVAQQRLEELKLRAKKAFKRCAMDLHPDRTNGDPAKTEDFKLVSSAVDEIDKLVMQRPQPQPQMRVVFIRVGGFNTYSSTATTTSYWNGHGF